MQSDVSSQNLSALLVALGGTELHSDGGIAHFQLADLGGYAYVKSGGSRLRGSVILHEGRDPKERDAAEAWLARQPRSKAGVLEVVSDRADGWLLRVLFERSLGAPLSDGDPLGPDCAALAAAWGAGVTLSSLPSIDSDFSASGDPRDLPPRNAWVLMGDAASWPTDDELKEGAQFAEAGVFELMWTCAKQTVAGDLAFVYFTSPRKHIAFVARAASDAFFDTETTVNADRAVRAEQWWAYWSPLVPVEPIPYAALQVYSQGYLPLRGRSGHYLRPDTAERILSHVEESNGLDAELRRVLKPVVGMGHLPEPHLMTQGEWRAIAPGALSLEKQVETHVVEPLARFALPPGFRLDAQRPVGRRFADYVVLDEAGRVRSVIEVKVRIRKGENVAWQETPDFRQVQGYAKDLGCPAMLIDCTDIHLIDNGAVQPSRSYSRSEVGVREMRAVGTHLTG